MLEFSKRILLFIHFRQAFAGNRYAVIGFFLLVFIDSADVDINAQIFQVDANQKQGCSLRAQFFVSNFIQSGPMSLDLVVDGLAGSPFHSLLQGHTLVGKELSGFPFLCDL